MTPTKSFNRYPWLPGYWHELGLQVKEIKASAPLPKTSAPTPLADYIERVLEAEKGLPELVSVDAKVLKHAIACLQQRGYPAVARELQKALDKS